MDRGVTIIAVELGSARSGQRLDRALADAVPSLSRERIKALMQSGAIRTIAGTLLTQASSKIDGALSLTITLPPPESAIAQPQDMPLVIAYEDDHLVVVDKPAGMVVHPASGNYDGTLVNALLHHCAGQLSGIGGVARPGIVHRIDKDTSGLIVVAKSDAAHEGLARQFFDHSIDRVYWAIVAGQPLPTHGTVDAPLARSSHDRKKIAVVATGRGKRAVTHFRTLEPLNGATLMECRLETGRTHQVRVHMAHIGHSLLGDPVYGRYRPTLSSILRSNGFVRQALHATRLGFIHPIGGQAVTFDSSLPNDMQDLLTQLRV